MRALLAYCVLTSACVDDEAALPVDVQLTRVTAIAGEHRVVGIDTDGDGGLWIAYQMQSAPFTFDDLRITHLDAAGTKLVEWRDTTPRPTASGIAVTGDAIWVQHHELLRKLDIATGAEVASHVVEAGIVDIAVRGDALLLSSLWREVIAIDAATGAQQWRSGISALAASESRGIASTADGMWVVSLVDGRVVRIDDQGETLEVAAFGFGDDWMADDGLHLTADGDQLILHRRNQISWYAR